MAESWESRLARWAFNWFPAYRATGARITYVSSDWREVRVRLPLCRRTRNYVGTLFGGSMYAAVDPVYMVMLIKLLGPGYQVWDKAATIRFRRPGRGTLRAVFRVSDAELEAIRETVARDGKAERQYLVELVDDQNEVHASCDKLLSIRARRKAAGSSTGWPEEDPPERSSPRPGKHS